MRLALYMCLDISKTGCAVTVLICRMSAPGTQGLLTGTYNADLRSTIVLILAETHNGAESDSNE